MPLVGTPSDDVSEMLTTGRTDVTTIYVSMTERHPEGSDAEYLDANYGGILIIWDRMFGSFVPEGKRPTYGLTKNIGTYNLLRVGFQRLGSRVTLWNRRKTRV